MIYNYVISILSVAKFHCLFVYLHMVFHIFMSNITLDASQVYYLIYHGAKTLSYRSYDVRDLIMLKFLTKILEDLPLTWAKMY